MTRTLKVDYTHRGKTIEALEPLVQSHNNQHIL